MSTTDDVPRSSCTLTLAAVPSAIGCAGLFVRYVLTRWRLVGMLPVAENAVSDLVARAVKTSGIVERESGWSDLDERAFVRIRVILTSVRLLIEVWDHDTTPPSTERPTSDRHQTGEPAAVGYTDHGYYHPREGGKVAWAELSLSTPLRPIPLSPPRPAPHPRSPNAHR